VTQVFAVVSQVILALAVPYFVLTLVLGVRVVHRKGDRLQSQEVADRSQDLGDELTLDLYFLVPCLNEERVIGPTVSALLADPGSRVVVIDDGSDDATASCAEAAAEAGGATGRLQVLRRVPPLARLGKGPALNAGLAVVREEVARRQLDPDRVVVGVMDADGRLSPGGSRVPIPLFDDPSVGGVQLTVRIRNRNQLIGRFQDVEFWMISALSQFGRSVTGTVSLGGNGQFTRLSALNSLAGDPWTNSLTEDLDLGLRLIAAGWTIDTTTSAYVDQQGVEKYRQLVRQRTRWYRGHMSSLQRLPELWRSPKVRQSSLLEVTAYLLVPWVIVLPWSLLQQWVLFQLLFGSGHSVFATGVGSVWWTVGYAVMWYLLSFLPNVLIGITYARRTRDVTLGYALVLAHLMLLWNYIGYLACWRAVFRMVRRRSGWDKTARSVEGADLPTGVPVLAAALPEMSRG
jgi:cellulose synthase/poly-beta-1,6-N-acetylglucosamine synthase-like glycosyltransferase